MFQRVRQKFSDSLPEQAEELDFYNNKEVSLCALEINVEKKARRYKSSIH